MRSVSSFGTFAFVLLGLAGCTGTFEPKGQPGESGTPGDGLFAAGELTCPRDPDEGLSGFGSTDPNNCPEVWLCKQLEETEGKICAQPGPGTPDLGTGTRCVESAGQIVCSGSQFPEGGGAVGYDCVQRSADVVECTNSTPSYPEGGGPSTWNCYFRGEIRFCTSGENTGSGWMCYSTPDGRECRQENTGFPSDDRAYSCYDAGDETICTASGSIPDGGGGNQFDCEQSTAEFITCTKPRETPDGSTSGGGDDDDSGGPGDDDDSGGPGDDDDSGGPGDDDDSGGPGDGGGGDTWDCFYAGELRICTESNGGDDDDSGGPGDDDDSGGPGDDDDSGDDDDDTPGGPGRPPRTGDSCPMAGQQMWCDDAVFCSWGKRTCVGSGTNSRWGPCIEPTLNADGLTDRPATALGCRYFYFNEAACEQPSCIIPAGHTAPACNDRGTGNCGYCDANECDGGDGAGPVAGRCVFKADGYAFCANEAPASGCPAGYEATAIDGMSLCTPVSQSCE